MLIFYKKNILGGFNIIKSTLIPLSKTLPNKIYKVLSVNCQKDIQRRILDLGIIPGTIIKNIRSGPFGDPTAFLVRGTVIAIRKEDTKKIIVETI